MRCYKAVRPDGTDFYSGTVHYVVGETVTHPTSTEMVPNDASTYLSVSTEPADCTGFQWPCRLFAVEPVGDVLTGMEYPYKVACLSLRVIEELPAWQAFGPNGQAVAAHIDRVAHLTKDEVRRLAAARAAARAAALAAALAAARDAARNAARAVLSRDLISANHFAVLTKPWRDAGLELPE
jgi:hypothetical protein